MSAVDPQRRDTAVLARAVRDGVRTLHPGYFAFVMATGILSVATAGLPSPVPTTLLLWVAAGGYLLLVALTLARVVAYPADVRRDFADPARGFGFFTFVAATDVLGTRLSTAGRLDVATALLVVGTAGWLLLGYVIPWTALHAAPRPVVAAANGTWFIWVVASQSVAVLAASVEPALGTRRRELALLAICCWAVGVFLYVTVGGLVTARLFLYDLRPADLTPPYWVTMGAGAITVVAGARISQMAQAPALLPTRGLITGVSVLFWAFASWLIPVLVAAGWWRHVSHRVPLRYEPTWWSVVFPLGMYAVASRTLGDAAGLPIVAAIGGVQTWVALAAWLAAVAVLLVRATRVAVSSFSRLDP